MIPRTQEDVVREIKERYKKAEKTCEHCGVRYWYDYFYRPYDFITLPKCRLDVLKRYCEGKCKYYEHEKPKPPEPPRKSLIETIKGAIKICLS